MDKFNLKSAKIYYSRQEAVGICSCRVEYKSCISTKNMRNVMNKSKYATKQQLKKDCLAVTKNFLCNICIRSQNIS